MLPSTRRPSPTTDGIASNVESSSTSCATARVAELPEPIATPMSASFSASTSFTPSPVIATTCPRDWSASTIARFCCGVTRPKIACVSSTSASSSPPSGSAFASNGASAPGRPTRRATAATVAGWSPLMTLTSTPCRAKYASVVDAVSRTRSVRITKATGTSRSGLRSVPIVASVRPRRTTRRPASACARAFARWASSSGEPRSTSGAPSTHVPLVPKSAPLHLRADENGTVEAASQPVRGVGEALADREEGGVRVGFGGGERRERVPVHTVLAEQLDLVDDQTALGERARLVDAQDVDAREHLDRRQLLDQHATLGQPDDADSRTPRSSGARDPPAPSRRWRPPHPGARRARSRSSGAG